MELAEKYGYRPNPYALSLVKQTSNMIGVVIPNLDMPYFTKVVDGIIQMAESQGFMVITCISHNNYQEEKGMLTRLRDQRVDGLLVSYSRETNDFSHLQEITASQTPLVFFDRHTEELEATYVISDDFRGASLAVEYLLKKGHRRIGHMYGPENLSVSFYRFCGYREALRKAGISYDESLVFYCEDDKARQIRHADHFHRVLPTLDAVFTFNDYAAYEVLKIARHLNLSVPKDFASSALPTTLWPNSSRLSSQLSASPPSKSASGQPRC
ncbi:MAG: LacI family transcriptional regulator [Bacteroidia bacterium]|nr:LacI family transcriptional regulator [Bacteroidia bacterium]